MNMDIQKKFSMLCFAGSKQTAKNATTLASPANNTTNIIAKL